jgi:hypothetical protein
MAKQLIKWNGRAQGNKYRNGVFYVAAYSEAEAARLIMKAGGMEGMSGLNEIKKYYSKAWGNPMQGIEPTEPCVYVQIRYGGKPPARIL